LVDLEAGTWKMVLELVFLLVLGLVQFLLLLLPVWHWVINKKVLCGNRRSNFICYLRIFTDLV
jgi:hypothetical protein